MEEYVWDLKGVCVCDYILLTMLRKCVLNAPSSLSDWQ